MTQDINKIIDGLSSEWAHDMVMAKRKIAVLAEENDRLKAEIDQLKKEKDDSSE